MSPMAKVTITISDSTDGGVTVSVVTDNMEEKSTANNIAQMLGAWCLSNTEVAGAMPIVQSGEARCH
jgi:hypothetical protein